MPFFRLQQRDKANGEAVALALFHWFYRHIVLRIPFSNCPQSVMRCLRHSQLQYVFIGRWSKTWVIASVCVGVNVRVDKCVLWIQAAQNWGLEFDDSPSVLDEVTWRTDVTCPDTHRKLQPRVTSPWCGFEREVPETNCHLRVERILYFMSSGQTKGCNENKGRDRGNLFRWKSSFMTWPLLVRMYHHMAPDFRSLMLEYFNLNACKSCSCLLGKGGVPKAARQEACECLSDERWDILKTILNYPD